MRFVIFNRLADSRLASLGHAGHRGSLDSPVLDLQPTHPPKFAFVVCNQCQPSNHGMRSDPEIVVSDHLASLCADDTSADKRSQEVLPLGLTRCFGFFKPQVHEPFQGLTISRPQSSKSATFRVASLAPRTWAMAAICASALLIGLPSARR